MTEQQTSRENTEKSFKQMIIQTAKTQKPETTAQLIKTVQEKTGLPSEEITELLIQLENENKLHFTKKQIPLSTALKGYFFSKQATWYWTAIIFSVITAITIFAIPNDAYPFVYIRSALGTVLILFFPGFTLVKMLYPSKLPIQAEDKNIDMIERLTLSIGLSLTFIAIIGLVLNYTPWGLRLTPITLSLLALTVAFATAAIIREHQTKVATKNS